MLDQRAEVVSMNAGTELSIALKFVMMRISLTAVSNAA
jgi:hypothetical protein